jgi:iron complex transport system substrate-binding protein
VAPNGATSHALSYRAPYQSTVNTMPKLTLLLAIIAAILCGCSPHPSIDPTPDERRIVSLAPSLTEILFAIGASNQLVGRTDVCDTPPAATNIAIVGGFGRPSIDTLALTRPTHIWWVDIEDRELPAMFTRLGWQGERFACKRLADIPTAIEKLGQHTDCTPAATQLAATLRAGIAAREAATLADTPRPTVLVVVWWTPLMTCGRESFIGDIITLAGGRLITEEVERDYFTVSDEWALRQNPDTIICLDYTPPGESLKRLRNTTGWCSLNAVKEGRVYNHLDANVLYRPGPRVLEAVDSVRALLDSHANK